MLFFQFDEDKYYESHSIKAYYDYRKYGFGPVCTDIDNLNKDLDVILHNNSVISKTYLDRVNIFFPINDDINCHRIYELIFNIHK